MTFVFTPQNLSVPLNTETLIVEDTEHLTNQFNDLKLNSLELREPLKDISRKCFVNCDIKTIIFPSTLTKICVDSFLNTNTAELKNFENTNVKEYPSLFGKNQNDFPIILPTSLTSLSLINSRFKHVEILKGSSSVKTFKVSDCSVKTLKNDTLYIPDDAKILELFIVFNNYLKSLEICELPNSNITIISNPELTTIIDKQPTFKKISETFKHNSKLKYILLEHENYDEVVFEHRVYTVKTSKTLNLNKYINDFHVINSDLFDSLRNDNVDFYDYNFEFENVFNINNIEDLLKLFDYNNEPNFINKLNNYYLNLSKIRATNLINILKKLIDGFYKNEFMISENSIRLKCPEILSDEELNLKDYNVKKYFGCYNPHMTLIKQYETKIVNSFSLIHKISKYGFMNSNLKKIVLSDDIVKIGESAFEKCLNLESVVLGKYVKSIGELAFCDCRKLKNINLENIIVDLSIKKYAFGNCEQIEHIKLPKHLKILSEGVFCDCRKLTVLEINDELEEIHESAIGNTNIKEFIGGTNLKYIFDNLADRENLEVIDLRKCKNLLDFNIEPYINLKKVLL